MGAGSIRAKEDRVQREGTELLAYCGLYCGDCAGHTGEIADGAGALIGVLERYRFEKTARALFHEELGEIDRLVEALRFMSGLRCPRVCREREEPCDIARCCLDRGFEGCYECDDIESCDTLARLEELHGNSCLKNLKAIREMGAANWVANGPRLWFGSDTDAGS